jgi:hypothetical protein
MVVVVDTMSLELVGSMRVLAMRPVCGIGYVAQVCVLMLSGKVKTELSVGSADAI